MFCTKCGTPVSKNQKFCNKCGKELNEVNSKVAEEQTASSASTIDELKNVEGPENVKAEIKSKNSVEANDKPKDTNVISEEKPLAFYCSKCGSDVKKTAKFCTKCGESLEAQGKISNEKPEVHNSLNKDNVNNELTSNATKTEEKGKNKPKKDKKEKESKGIFKKILLSLVVVLTLVLVLCISAILYTHYSSSAMAYEAIDYEEYIKENIKEMIEEKTDDSYVITVGSDLINSALNSNLEMINKNQNDISIDKTYFDIETQRLYFTMAYKNFDLNLSSHVDLSLDEQAMEIKLDDIKAGGKNIPVPGLITNLLPSDLLNIRYDVEQIPDFIITNEIEYEKSNVKVNFAVDYKSLANDLNKYKSINNIDQDIVNIYQFTSSSYEQTLGDILDPHSPLTPDNVKAMIDLYEENANVLKDILIAFDKNTVDAILKDYNNYINITIDSSSLKSAKESVIRENFFGWIDVGTAPGVHLQVGDSLDDVFDVYGYDYYYGDWNEYEYYFYEYLDDPDMDTGGVVFLTPYSYYSNDYYNISVIELYEPYDFMGINLSMTIPEIIEILGEPKNQFYDYENGYYKTIYKSGSYLVSFYSYDVDSECYYVDIKEY